MDEQINGSHLNPRPSGKRRAIYDMDKPKVGQELHVVSGANTYCTHFVTKVGREYFYTERKDVPLGRSYKFCIKSWENNEFGRTMRAYASHKAYDDELEAKNVFAMLNSHFQYGNRRDKLDLVKLRQCAVILGLVKEYGDGHNNAH